MSSTKAVLGGALRIEGANDELVHKANLSHEYDGLDEAGHWQVRLPKGGGTRTTFTLSSTYPRVVHMHCDQTYQVFLPAGTSVGNFQNHVLLGFPTNRSVASVAVSLVGTTSAVFSMTLGASA